MLAVAAGQQVELTWNGVSNPGTAGATSLSLSTSSDPTPVVLGYVLTASPNSVGSAGLVLSSLSASATQVSYKATFTATNGLTAGFSTVSLVGPVGTVFQTYGPSQYVCGIFLFKNLTTSQTDSCGFVTSGGASAVVSAQVLAVAAGQQVELTWDGVTNPSTIGTTTMDVSTTSDPGIAQGTYFIGTLAPPTFTAASPPSPANVGTPYSYTFTATGSPAPTFSLNSGTLPTGLSLASSGALTGTPTATGTFTFTVKAANGQAPDAVTGSLQIVVNAAPVFTNASPPSPVTVGTPYTYTFTASGSPAPTFSVTLGALPTGLSLASNGALTGTPTATGTFNFQVTATNTAGNAVTGTLTIVVNGLPAPDTVIDTGPSGLTASTGATFTFHSVPGGGSFECSLDGAAFSTCTTPKAYSGLGQGLHMFKVRATVASVTDPSPATAAWTVDTVAPVVVCGSADGLWHLANVSIACTSSDSPAGLLVPADASFMLSTTVVVGVEDPNASTGTHQVCDTLNNCATAGPIAGNKIDRKNPAITITAPVDLATFTQGQVVNANYACVDGGSGVATCVGPVATGSPIDTSTIGTSIAFTVSSTDNVGNAATRTVRYDVVAPAGLPDTVIDNVFTLGHHALVTFHSVPGGATFECSLDGTPFTVCSSPKLYNNLLDGAHAFAVRAVNGVGTDPTPATRSFTIGGNPPRVSLDRPNPGEKFVNDHRTGFVRHTDKAFVTGFVTMRWTVGGRQFAIDSFVLTIDGVTVPSSQISVNHGRYSFLYVPASPGDHTIEWVVTNTAGGATTDHIVINTPV